MQAILMITNGGAHAPDYWARVTASQIIKIGGQAPAATLRDAEKLEQKIIEILTPHHAKVQEHEKNAIASDGPACQAHLHVDDPVDEIIEAAQGSTFADHFNRPEVRDYLARVVHEHFRTSMDIERSWHADRQAAKGV